MWQIKLRNALGKWYVLDTFAEQSDALASYNSAPVPRMLTKDRRIVHKQYSDNGFIYTGRAQ